MSMFCKEIVLNCEEVNNVEEMMHFWYNTTIDKVNKDGSYTLHIIIHRTKT